MAAGSAAAMATNCTELTGTLQERGHLRYTPAGIPVIEFRIAHRSEQNEASISRRVECEIACTALGPTALLLQEASPGIGVAVSGFLAARSLKQKTPVLHVTQIEFAENFRKGY
ncbi:MAG: primosomal replication protein N [Pseudomonadota bacterium]